MRTFRLFSAFLAIAICSLPAFAAEKAFPVPAAKESGGEFKFVHGVPVMVLRGTPKEMGEQHGKLVGKYVKELLDYPKTFLKKSGREKHWPLMATGGKLLLLRMSADHRAEMQATIRSSGLDSDSIVVANTMLELRRMGGCSTLMIGKDRSKTGGILFGRNFDFPPLGILDRYGTVTVVHPKGKHSFISVGYPGLLGVISGMNDAGLCLATLDVYRSKDGSPAFDPTGVPMMFTFRRILEECRTIQEAEALLRKSKATTWMNLAVCDKESAVVFELTPMSVLVRKPVEGVLPCTNHFRSPELCTSKTCRRYLQLIKCREMKRLGLKDVAKLLHAANQRTWTIQTMIFEPAAMKLHVSLKSPPTSGQPLTALDVKKLLGGP